jgi:hypothetical protein
MSTICATGDSASITNVLVSGFLFSGSSAVVDLLRGYDCVTVRPGEFDEFRRPGKVGDHLSGLIDRFYPNRLFLPCDWKLLSRRSFLDLAKRILGRSPSNSLNLASLREWIALQRLTKILLDPDCSTSQKIACSREWIEAIQKIHISSGRFLVFDQPLLWGSHSKIWPQVFSPFKLIAVSRNPLDQLADVMRNGHLLRHFRSPDADFFGPGREGAVRYFLSSLSKRLDHWRQLTLELEDCRFLMVTFEETVLTPIATTQIIQDFLGFQETERNIVLQKRVFDPVLSQANVGIEKHYLTDEEREIAEPVVQEWEALTSKPV